MLLFCVGPVSVHAACNRLLGNVYVDGIETGSSTGRNVWKGEFANTPKLIAARCRRASRSSAWFLASLSNGFITEDSWKCKKNSDPFPSTWMDTDFDDASWNAAVAVDNTYTISDVSDNDATIWWKTGSGGERTSYFRGTLGKRSPTACTCIPLPIATVCTHLR